MKDLQIIFSRMRGLLTMYRPPLVSKIDDPTHFDLWSVKDLIIEGRRRKEIYFAGLIIHKDYVGFYFMPVYIADEIKAIFAPDLLKLLKGKSCFHIKKIDEHIFLQYESALKSGFELYQQRGWV